jgi:hypothetical protein
MQPCWLRRGKLSAYSPGRWAVLGLAVTRMEDLLVLILI